MKPYKGGVKRDNKVALLFLVQLLQIINDTRIK